MDRTQTASPDQALVAALVRKQTSLRDLDIDFARRLGISRQAWALLREGGMRPGLKTLRGVRRAFPDLAPLVEMCLANQ